MLTDEPTYPFIRRGLASACFCLEYTSRYMDS